MDLLQAHKLIYDSLAEEYEAKVEKHIKTTSTTMDWFAEFITTGKSVLDLGCGVGLASKCLIEKGFELTGIDISKEMLRFYQARNPSAHIIEDDFMKTDFKQKFDGIVAFAFIHLFPKKQALKVLRKISDILAPGGVALIGSTDSSVSKEGWENKDDYLGKKMRFRKHWQKEEFRKALKDINLKEIALNRKIGGAGKIWLDFVVKKT